MHPKRGYEIGKSARSDFFEDKAMIIGFLVLLFSATGVFGPMQDSLIFFGAEMTPIYARFHGRLLEPEEHAEKTPDAKEEQERHRYAESAGR